MEASKQKESDLAERIIDAIRKAKKDKLTNMQIIGVISTINHWAIHNGCTTRSKKNVSQ